MNRVGILQQGRPGVWAALLAVMLLGPSQPFAQSTGGITGLVVGPDDQPLPGTSIFVFSATVSSAAPVRPTVTDISGRFTITGLPSGSYRVVADLPGFALSAQRTMLTADLPDATVTFALTVDAPPETIILSPPPPQLKFLR